MYYRATKGVAVAVLLTIGSVLGLQSRPALADDATGRIYLLEARVLKLEAASNEQSGMLKHMVVLNQDPQSGSATIQPAGGAADAEMGIGTAGAPPATVSKDMPKSAGCCSGMMGKMGGAAPTSTPMPSGLPGFPGAAHLYHMGATGFFLDSPDTIKLTLDQQAALNAIREQSIGNHASAQRQIDQAEQELWILTSSDQPDTPALEKKIHEIEHLNGEQRIAFIRSVGEAARILTEDQRAALLGTVGSMGGNRPDTKPKASGMEDM